MNQIYSVDLPSVVYLDNGKEYSLNLNVYRNAHYRVNHAAKIKFAEYVKDLLSHIPTGSIDRCLITYSLCPGSKSKRPFDVANFGSVIDKFFCDLLVSLDILPEDNYKHVLGVAYVVGNVSEFIKVTATIEVLSTDRTKPKSKKQKATLC